MNLIPENGALFVNGDDPVAVEIAAKAFCKVERFGVQTDSEWSAKNISLEGDASNFDVFYKNRLLGTVSVPLFGNYNIMNALAALAAATRAGLPFESIKQGMALFKRPKRRMEIIGTFPGNITLIEDFAHHPTAVRVTLEAIEQLYAGRRIVTCFEPRSNTTTRNIFQQELSECFGPAAIVVIGKVHRPDRYPPDQSLNISRLKELLEKQGKTVFLGGQNSTNYPDDIVAFLQNKICDGDVVILLSNGSFNNLKTLLSEFFQKNC